MQARRSPSLSSANCTTRSGTSGEAMSAAMKKTLGAPSFRQFPTTWRGGAELPVGHPPGLGPSTC